MELLRKTKWIYVILSIIYITLGVVLLIYPAQTVNVICRIIGITAVVLGIYEILKYIFKYGSAFSAAINLITGIFSLVCGIILISNPDFVKSFFPVIIGILVVLDSAFKLKTSFELRSKKSKTWWGIFILSAVGIVLGFVIVFNAGKVTDLIVRIVGAALIIDGIENIVSLCFSARVLQNIIKSESPLEAEFTEIKTEPESKEGENK